METEIYNLYSFILSLAHSQLVALSCLYTLSPPSIEETWRLWCKFLEDYSRFEDWLKMAEQSVVNPNSANVLYTVAKEELKKFEVRVVRAPNLKKKNVFKACLFVINLTFRAFKGKCTSG